MSPVNKTTRRISSRMYSIQLKTVNNKVSSGMYFITNAYENILEIRHRTEILILSFDVQVHSLHTLKCSKIVEDEI